MKILIFAGAGTSVELGIPTMRGMALEFLDHVKQWNVEPEIAYRLMGEQTDIEILIESLDQIHNAQGAITALSPGSIEIEKVERVRSEVEWFVQHLAERITPIDARLMWGPVLNSGAKHELIYVTTNYDRAIELAANAENVSLVDGFEASINNETGNWVGFQTDEGGGLLVKLHGSTDWYSDHGSDTPWRLRHPMPLFGGGTLRLPSGRELGSALILPSREKLLTRMPYPWLSKAFLDSALDCEGAIFIGSSLRDHHVRSTASQILASRPVVIVDPAYGSSPDEDDAGLNVLEGALYIGQTASRFLISTLPEALSHQNPFDRLKTCQIDQPNDSIFSAVRVATDREISAVVRCEAIEKLFGAQVTLNQQTLLPLVNDQDNMVARYALGLIPRKAYP